MKNKMKNTHVLPTDKPSRLHFDSELFISPKIQLSKSINSIVEGRNIFITSDEEIKEGDYFLYDGTEIRYKSNGTEYHGRDLCHISGNRRYPISKSKKIILTTDQSLDGVQSIDDEFLEWFVKNSSCESVEVKRIFLGNSFVYIGKTPSKKEKLRGCYDNGEQIVGKWKELFTYEIIIPKEEPKKVLTEEDIFNQKDIDAVTDYINKEQQKQHLIDIMKGDEELGLYDETIDSIKLEEVLGSKHCLYSVIENKLSTLYRNQEKILSAIKMLNNGGK
jgi:hypothetical protein